MANPDPNRPDSIRRDATGAPPRERGGPAKTIGIIVVIAVLVLLGYFLFIGTDANDASDVNIDGNTIGTTDEPLADPDATDGVVAPANDGTQPLTTGD